MDEKLADTQSKIDDLKAKADTAEETEKPGIMEEIKKLEAEKDAISSKVSGYEADATTVEKDVSSAETNMKNLEGSAEGFMKDAHI